MLPGRELLLCTKCMLSSPKPSTETFVLKCGSSLSLASWARQSNPRLQ